MEVSGCPRQPNGVRARRKVVRFDRAILITGILLAALLPIILWYAAPTLVLWWLLIG